MTISYISNYTKSRETRVKGEEGSPKTKRSIRDATMLPPVVKAMKDQKKYTLGKSEYVFLNQYRRPVLPDSLNQHIWKTTLTKAKLADSRLRQGYGAQGRRDHLHFICLF
jgi:integrase